MGMEFAGIGKRDKRIQTPGYRGGERHGSRRRSRREGVSCAESIIFISRGTVTSYPILISECEPAKCPPSLPPPPRESSPPRIDRFKMRELCIAVIPRCNDLSITSSRAVLYALMVLSQPLPQFSRVLGGWLWCARGSPLRIVRSRFEHASLKIHPEYICPRCSAVIKLCIRQNHNLFTQLYLYTFSFLFMRLHLLYVY